MRFRFAVSAVTLICCGAGFAEPVPTTPTQTGHRAPNIILMLADDFGYSDLGSYGSTYHETPNLDQLAKDGVRFTDAYAAAPICSPSRAAIMSGKFPARFSLTHFIHNQDAPGAIKKAEKHKLKQARFSENMPLEEQTIAETLKQNGYKTFIAGKWHLGRDYDGYGPTKQGFDIAIASRIGGHTKKYFSPYEAPELPDGPEGEYLTDRLSSETATFITDNKDRPFFVYHSFYAVHLPLQGKPDLVDKYTRKRDQLGLKHETTTEGSGKVKTTQSDPVYAAMVQSMDEAAGNIINTVKKLGLERDTLIIFTSDNGGLATNGKDGGPTTNLPLRAGKGWMYDGGLRVPLIVSWPGTIPADKESSAVVAGTDLYPTILEAAGIPRIPAQHIDGDSILPALKSGTASERKPVFWHFPHYGNQNGTPASAVRLGDWKLIKWYEGNKVELFNMADDTGEKNDLATKNPAKRDELLTTLESWLKSIDAKIPVPREPGT